MALVLGLLAAFLWGISDFLISVSGRSFGVHRAMLYAQGVGVLLVGGWIGLGGASFPEAAALSSWAAAVIAAPIGVVATLALYQGLKIGQVSVVAPIAASFGAVTAALSLLGGEHVPLQTLLGIASVITGVMLVSFKAGDPVTKSSSSGAPWGVFSAVAYGVQFWIQGKFAVPELGSIWPVWIYYLSSASILAVAAAVRRRPMALPVSGLAIVASTGGVAVCGFLALSAGLATGELALVSVLASLQTIVTICLACVFHRERLAMRQWAGLAVTLGGLATLHLQ
ncbi:DMT family transporter [Sphingomonas sp.]|uniref:DMT family transporter n=1 Tax=Sphingomonas sp. TaxID=28214 RepID=UPI0031E3BF17